MALDKTTGKGCALCIAAVKTITKRLIAEGIVNQPISRRYRKSSCNLLQAVKSQNGHIYIELQRVDSQEETPIWTPSFLSAAIWERAVNRFQPYRSLKTNLEYFLLPEIDAYPEAIPETGLVLIIETLLRKHGVLHSPIRQCSGKTYYFNESEVYSLDKGVQLFPYGNRNPLLFEIRGEPCFNMTLWHKAVARFEVGMTLADCVQVFLKTKLVYQAPREPSDFERLVLSIGPPIYEQVSENKNKATIDRIRVVVGLSRYRFSSWGDLRNEVNKFRHEIYRQVIQRVKEDRRFKKYGVPINFLKIDAVTLLRDFSIEFIFEPKAWELPP